MRQVAANSQKKVLVLGAGYVSAPVVDYLTREKSLELTAGKNTFQQNLSMIQRGNDFLGSSSYFQNDISLTFKLV